MMNALIAEIEKKGLTQAQAAKLLGVTQPRVSDLMRGRLHLFSIDALVNFLGAAACGDLACRQSSVTRYQ